MLIASGKNQTLCAFSLVICANSRREAQVRRNFAQCLLGAVLTPIKEIGTDAASFIARVNASPNPRVDWRFGCRPYFDVADHFAIGCKDEMNIFRRIKTRR